MEYNSHVYPRSSASILSLLDRLQERSKFVANDDKVSNSIDSLEHCYNVACVSLFHRYYNRFGWSEISGLIADNHVSFVALVFYMGQ